jgi:tRNA (guanine26-N2/guanine27-N2)-dimethyltransferase
MNYDTIKEGKAKIAVPKFSGKVVTSKMPVFYNSVMKSNRDITIALMAASQKVYGKMKWRVADVMAASGVRSIRMLLELGKIIESIAINDYSESAVKIIKKNLVLNKLKSTRNREITVSKKNSNILFLESKSFNYADIDPFGYPGPFLDAAIKKIPNKGILAVTATDTSALSGAAVNACKRKYLTVPLKNSFMQETGIRILIRLVQLIGAINDKAMVPVFSYYKEHYTRVFFVCRSGSGRVNDVLKMHKEIFYCSKCCAKGVGNSKICGNCKGKNIIAGPVWVGNLFDSKLVGSMVKEAVSRKEIDAKIEEFLSVIANEAKVEGKTGIGSYSVEKICSKYGIGQQPKPFDVIKKLKKAGYVASGTHCTTTGIKTDAPVKKIVAIIKGKAL